MMTSCPQQLQTSTTIIISHKNVISNGRNTSNTNGGALTKTQATLTFEEALSTSFYHHENDIVEPVLKTTFA